MKMCSFFIYTENSKSSAQAFCPKGSLKGFAFWTLVW